MMQFLEAIARRFRAGYADLADFMFVFPNKRAGTFFLNHLRRASDSISVAPMVISIPEFVAELSQRVIDSRLDLLLMLFSEYRKIVGEERARFDKFRAWGEMVLADFNDVDMYEADARKLFKNVSDLRDIRTDFLTDEQREVVREYFGIEDQGISSDTGRFWKHYNGREHHEGDSRSRFAELWQVLGELYENMHSELDKRGLAYPGMAYRIALERLRELGTDALPGVRKVVMVGFNALSTVEFHIFKELAQLHDPKEPSESFGDFYWDRTGPPMADETNSAVHFMRKNIKFFPSRFSIEESDKDTLPDVIKSISSPSGSAQAKIASGIVADIADRVGEKAIDMARLAVVLPDENLLLPLLYSLPQDMKNVNLTMGYSMKLTGAASFVKLLRKLQQRKRPLNGVPHFFHEDVKMVLSHPYTASLGYPGEAVDLRRRVARGHKYLLNTSDFSCASPAIRQIFSDMGLDEDGFVVAHYIDTALQNVADSLQSRANDGSRDSIRLDLSLVSLYRDALARLMNAILKYGIKMSTADIFSLADGLIRGESVRFEGRPLKGLQVMGPLETRCLDFDYVIILSMNERVYPRRLRKGSFIPASLRKDYGLATIRFQESIFAYNFYRMISRAKEVYMIHDARTEGLKSGDVSRYILQLKYLYAPGLLQSAGARFPIMKSDTRTYIRKSDEVMRHLEPYTWEKDGKKLSASALKAYISCPLKFYLEYVKNLREDNEPEEFMEASIIGNVMHGVMQALYTPDPSTRGRLLESPVTITTGRIENLLSEQSKEIDDAIRRMINKEYYHLEDDRASQPLGPEGMVYRDTFRSITERVLRHDLNLAPFDILGTEIDRTVRIRIPDGLTLNMKYIIDRLDTGAVDDDGNRYMRVVDYKTGYFNLEISSMDDIFTSGSGHDALFQLMLYAHLLRQEGTATGPVGMEIYDLRRIGTPVKNAPSTLPKVVVSKGENPAVAGCEEGVIKDFSACDDEFTGRLNAMLCEIMSPEGEFAARPSQTSCLYCPFKSICRR